MVLQSSGAISLNDLATEFGGSAPHSINEYYRGGGLVPDTSANAGIPASGQIDLNDFYNGDSTTTLSGTAYTWGSTKSGALGTNNEVGGVTATGVRRALYSGTDWTSVTMRNDNGSSTGVRSDGKLWGWGGPTCSGHPTTYSTPVQIGSATDWEYSYPDGSLANSNGVAAFKKQDGKLWFLGGMRTAQQTDQTLWQEPTGSTAWTDIGCTSSNGHAFIKTDGKLWTIGSVPGLYLGAPDGLTMWNEPSNSTSWTDVAVDRDIVAWGATSALKSNGSFWYSGLHRKQTIYQNVPQYAQVTSITSMRQLGTETHWEHVTHAGAVGQFGAIKNDGRHWIWGQSGSYGYPSTTFSTGSASWRALPTSTVWSTDRNSFVGQSAFHGIKPDGTLWSHGFNGNQGWLGLGAPAGVGSSLTQNGSDTSWFYVQMGEERHVAIKS